MSDKPKIGFARLTPEEHKKICSRGGKMSQQGGHANRFTRETARAAGQLSGHVKRKREREQSNG